MSLKNKLALLAFIAENPKLVSDGLKLAKEAGELIEKIKNFSDTIKSSEKQGILFNLLKNQETEQNSEKDTLVTAKYHHDSLSIETTLPPSVYQKFEHLDLTENQIEDGSSKNISDSDFKSVEGKISTEYKSEIVETKYLGNKHLIFKSTVSLIEENGLMYALFHLNLFNHKTKEHFVVANERFPIHSIEFKNHDHLPVKLNHSVYINSNYDLVLSLNIK